MRLRRVYFSPGAEADLARIQGYISEAGNPEAALDYSSAIFTFCNSLSLFPERGSKRDDLRPGLRIVGFDHRATVAFVVADDAVTIVGVFRRGRNFETVLRGRGPEIE